jgi:serine protease Do
MRRERGRMVVLGMTALVLSAGGAGSPQAPAASAAGAAPAVVASRSLPAFDFRDIVQSAKDKVFPAVVFIKVLQENLESGRKVTREIAGSGVIISAKGELLTNRHVVDKATEVRCLLYDGRALTAKVVGADKDTDLALVQLNLPEGSAPLPVAEMGDSALLKEGDFVMAMGAPWGLNRSVSIGIIACTRRFLQEYSEYSLWLQTDASICPGNSGGPLVNTAGKVIGINALGVSSGGDMGFAIPAQTIRYILPQLRESGSVNWSWTGLQLQALRDFNRNIYFEGHEGVMVAETDPESPARAAGILPKDRILSVNGQPMNGLVEEDLPGLRRQLGLLPKRQVAKFALLRNNQPMTIDVTPREKGKVEGEELDCPRWDLTVKTINQFDNADLYYYRQKGVFIYGVKYPGNAASAGLGAKDILLKIEDKEILTLDDVKAAHKTAIDNLQTRHRIVFTVLRAGLMRQVVLDYERDYEKE